MRLDDLVRCLGPEWEAILDGLLVRRKAPKIGDIDRLAPKVAEVSRAYNDGRPEQAPLEARLAFSFPRDVPKGAGAVRELVASGLLSAPLRILDIGAGLGAMTLGIVRALEAAGAEGKVEALLVDADARALDLAKEIAAASPKGKVALDVTTRVAKAGAALPEADLVVAGQVLSELDPDLDEPARIERHAELVRDWLGRAPTVVIVEPALRDRTRHLHAVRDRVLAADPGVAVFSPCLHREPCPALANEGDWCHEDLAVDLPPFLVPLARAAGLRWEGLTFTQLVLRRDGARLFDRTKPGAMRLRVVSDVMRTKGKTELFSCNEHGRRTRLRRLDRDERAEPTGFPDLSRGDVVTLDVDADEKGTLPRTVHVDVWPRGH